jgi:hypothetical protein
MVSKSKPNLQTSVFKQFPFMLVSAVIVREIRNAYRILVGIPEEKEPLWEIRLLMGG